MRLWVEMQQKQPDHWYSLSASSWGCELKYKIHRCIRHATAVSLFVRLWVEILSDSEIPRGQVSQPLREAVSWNIEITYDITEWISQPLREAVSWNSQSCRIISSVFRQPLREAVSWNEIKVNEINGDYCQPLREAVSWNSSKSEIRWFATCQPLREAVSWNMMK